MRKSLIPTLFVLVVLLCLGAPAQSLRFAEDDSTVAHEPALSSALPGSAPVLPAPVVAIPALTPRLSPDVALSTYQLRTLQQAERLTAYSDTTVMEAELPDSAQRAAYELKRHYSAPKTLEYKPVQFTGDGFVKSNVLVRLLQSEVEHVNKQQSAQTAIDDVNYKFNLKSVEDLNGHSCYMFHVKPRKNRVGLFKGRVFIDAYSGALRRAEGTLVKSPSWWIKKVEFVQDYDEIAGFNLPVRLHSVTKARVIGRAIVDVFHRDYQAVAANPTPATSFGGGERSSN